MSDEPYQAPPLSHVMEWIEGFDESPEATQIEIIKQVVSAHLILEVEYGHPSTRMFRVRKVDKTNLPASYSGVIWPPASSNIPGRLGSIDHPLLYLSRHGFTAFAETGVGEDDVVIIHFKIGDGQALRLTPIGEFERLTRSGISEFISDPSAMKSVRSMLVAMGPEAIKSILLMDSFLLSCAVNQGKDYRLSAELAKAVFRKHPESDGIAYASVKQRNGSNIAIRTSKVWPKIGITGVKHSVVRHLGYGVYDLGEGYIVRGINPDGGFRWSTEMVSEQEMTEWEPWTPHG